MQIANTHRKEIGGFRIVPVQIVIWLVWLLAMIGLSNTWSELGELRKADYFNWLDVEESVTASVQGNAVLYTVAALFAHWFTGVMTDIRDFLVAGGDGVA